MLHTVDDVLKNLNLADRWQVLRLIARGNLDAQVVAGGLLRFTSESIEAASRLGEDELVGPAFSQGWLDDKPENHRATIFTGVVRGVLQGMFPESDPGQDGTVRYTGAIAVAGDAASEPPSIGPRRGEPWPYGPTKQVYATSLIRRFAMQAIRNRSSHQKIEVEGSRPRNLLEWLYATPEYHREVMGKAMERFMAGQITERKFYPATDGVGRAIERRISLRHSDMLGISQPSTIVAAFGSSDRLCTEALERIERRQQPKKEDPKPGLKTAGKSRSLSSAIRISGKQYDD